MIQSASEPTIRQNEPVNEKATIIEKPATHTISLIWGDSKKIIAELYNTAKQGVVVGSIAGIRPLVIKNDFERENAQNLKKLDELSGSENFSHLLLILIPYATSFIKVKIEEVIKENTFTCKGIVTQIFRTRDDFLDNYFQALIFRLVTNFAKHTESVRVGIDQQGSFTEDLVVACIERLLSFVQTQFQNIDTQKFIDLDSRDDLEALLEKKDMFSDIVIDLISVILPNGEQDLIFNKEYIYSKYIVPKLWSLINTTWLPSLLIKLFRYHNLPNHHTEENIEALKQAGGDSINRGISITSEETVIHLPELLSNEVDGFAKMLPNYLEISEDMKKEYSLWSAEKLLLLLDSKHPALKRFWKITEEHLSSLLTRHIGKLSQLSTEGVDTTITELHLFPCIIQKVFSVLDNFLKNLDVSNPQDKDFSPLINEFCNLIGFDYHKKELVTLLRDHILPKHVHEIYNDIRAPLNCIPDFERRLCQFYYDPNDIMEHIAGETSASIESLFSAITNGENGFSIHQDEFWDFTGATRIKDQLKRVANNIGGDIRSFLIHEMEVNSPRIVEIINETLPRQKIEGKYVESLSEGIVKIATSDSEGVKALFDYLEKHISALVFKGVVNILTESPEVLIDSGKQLTPLNITLKFLEVVKAKLVNLKEEFLKAEKSRDSKIALRGVFVNFSEELVQMVFPNI